MTANSRKLPGRLVADLFNIGLSFLEVSRCVTAVTGKLCNPQDCEEAFRRYVSRRKREGRHA